MKLADQTSRIVSLLALLTLAGATAFGINVLIQKKAVTQKKAAEQKSIKLEFGNEAFQDVKDNLRPLAVSQDRLLVPVGDTFYMLDSQNRVVWEHSFEPNGIIDFSAAPDGTIYVALGDGLLSALNSSGKETWSHFMNGRANYTQIKALTNTSFLAVVSMEGYIENAAVYDNKLQDKLELWKDHKLVWSADFPRDAQLCLWDDKILAITRTQGGKEIKEISKYSEEVKN